MIWPLVPLIRAGWWQGIRLVGGIRGSSDRNARVAGNTKYSVLKMMRLAWTAISSFSALPLRITVWFGFLVTLIGFAYGFYSIFADIVLHSTVPGWTSLVCLNIVFSGATLMAIGLVGDYIARIYEEAKGRPLYVVTDSANLGNRSVPTAKGVILPADTPYEQRAKTADRV